MARSGSPRWVIHKGEDTRRERHKQRALVAEERGAKAVLEPAVVQVDADQTGPFVDGGLYLGLHEMGLCISIGADQQHECVCPPDLRSAFRFDVIRIARVDRFFQLEIRKVEVDVLVRLPRSHHVIALNVGAAEGNECASQLHVGRNLLGAR